MKSGEIQREKIKQKSPVKKKREEGYRNMYHEERRKKRAVKKYKKRRCRACVTDKRGDNEIKTGGDIKGARCSAEKGANKEMSEVKSEW